MAEVLITLGIIGVVVALTLPTVIQNYKKQVTITKLKKAYSLLGQVAQRSIVDNGAIELPVGEKIDANVAEKFFNSYWLPYFDGISIYSSNPKLNDDGVQAYKFLNNEYSTSFIGTNFPMGRIFFSVKDGTTYCVIVKGTEYVYDKDGNVVSQYSVFGTKQDVFVDINGIKPPNTFGKDVFLFLIDFDNGIVKPMTYNGSVANINANCKRIGLLCAAKIMQDGWQIKEDYPL